jgi:hypothetical protein
MIGGSEHHRLVLFGRRLASSSVILLLATAAGCSPGTPGTSPSTEPDPTAASPRQKSTGRSIYVATNGSDRADGTQQSPLQTITSAITRSRPGGSVVIGAGSYHETLKVEAHPDLTITAAPGATVWLDGSTLVQRWSKDGRLWSAEWRTEFDHSPTYTWGAPDNSKSGWQFVNPRHPMAAHPDQVWIDGKRQEQVASRQEVRPGAFYVDYDKHRLYLNADPDGHEVRASSIDKAITIRSPGVTVRGLNVRRFAPSVPHMGAVVVAGRRASLEDLTVRDNATTGVHILSSGVRVRNVTVVDNGMMGLTGTSANSLVLDHVVVEHNNVEQFNPSPSAGGAKIGRSQSVVIRDSAFERNFGTGLWFDESSFNVGIFDSTMIGNAGHGLSYEISGRADIVGNLIVGNQGNGIKINNSDDIQIWNNTLIRNNRAINIVQDDRDVNPMHSYRDPTLPLSWQSRHVAVRNNIMADSTGDCLLGMEDFTGRFSAIDLDVSALGNVYGRPDSASPRWFVVWSRGHGDPYAFRTMGQFRKTSEQEQPGVSLTGEPVVTDSYAPRRVVQSLVPEIAQPLPTPIARHAGLAAGVRHLGAWITAAP